MKNYHQVLNPKIFIESLEEAKSTIAKKSEYTLRAGVNAPADNY